MQVRELMSANPQICDQNTKIQDVAQMMVECDCGAIPVCEGNGSRKPIGMITDRDIVTRMIARGDNPMQRQAGSAMTRTTVTVSEDADINEVEAKMRDNHIKRVIVVDRNGDCTGIVSEADLVRTLSGEELEDMLRGIYEPMEGASSTAN